MQDQYIMTKMSFEHLSLLCLDTRIVVVGWLKKIEKLFQMKIVEV